MYKKLKNKSWLITNILILIIIYSNVIVAATQFTATVDRNSVSEGERIQITFSLNADGKGFKAPDFKGFTLLQGPSTSNQMQYVNGNFSKSMSFTYILQVGSKGKYKINPAQIQVNNQNVASNAIDITVLEPSAAQKAQSQQQKQTEKTLGDQANKLISQNLFVRVSANKNTVVVGDQITATYKIYRNPQINLTLEPSKAPIFNGFWAQDFDEKAAKWEIEVVNGVQFYVATIKKVVLIPQQSGKLTLDPFEFKANVKLEVNNGRRSNDPFDDFFGRGRQYKEFPYVAKSPSLTINVSPLPKNPPADFNGAVGQLTMDAWIDKSKVKTGEPVTLKVKIAGSGNLKLVEPLNIQLPPTIESYDPKVSDNTNVDLSGMSGNKVFEYILIPSIVGQYKLGPIGFTYYDLSKKQYVSLKSKEFIITIAQGDGAESSQIISGVKKQGIKSIGKDIRFIKLTSKFNQKGKSSLFGSLTFYSMLILPIIFFILFVYKRKKQDDLEGNHSLLRRSAATKVALKRLSSAKTYLSKRDKNKFYEEVTKALWGYISDKLSIPTSDLTKISAKEALLVNDITENVADSLLKTIDECEFARYAPNQGDSEMERLYKEASEIIAEIEQSFRGAK
jgi:hypothetical protein